MRLVVEDEKSLSRALAVILAKNGYSVDTVYDGVEALEYLKGGNYDGMILDVMMMPRMDGFGVLKRVRESGRDIPILMLTASATVVAVAMAAETARSFQALVKLQDKQFESNIEPLLSYTGEMKSIQRLFSILLDNALKYLPEGGQTAFRLEKRGRNLWVTVSNTAEPLSKEQLSHLFDCFYRVDTSRNSRTGGRGIGLSIARAIVNAHKGKISALSPDGKSLTIQVIL